MTRAAGLERLSDFLEGPGAAYSADRNTDRGPGNGPSTSMLSPYLRRRLITEAEVVAAADRAFGDGGAEKFVSEVFWRTYFKGHLETHPAAWTDFLAEVGHGHDLLAAEPGLRRIHESAIEGRAGIDGFDDWARELVETGWLHNHARMWFASIWIFTLRLPWALGAAFFMRHLVDGDPASNTLSWRWVAGPHTRGKHYVPVRRTSDATRRDASTPSVSTNTRTPSTSRCRRGRWRCRRQIRCRKAMSRCSCTSTISTRRACRSAGRRSSGSEV